MTSTEILTTTVRWWDWQHTLTKNDYRIYLHENDERFEYLTRQFDSFDQWMKSLDQVWERWLDNNTEITYTRGQGVAPYWMHELGTLVDFKDGRK